MIPLIEWIYLLDNLKNWDYEIGNYPLTAKDAEIVMETLRERLERSRNDSNTGNT